MDSGRRGLEGNYGADPLKNYEPVPPKMYSKDDLAAFYGVTVKVFESQIEPFEEQLGEMHGRYFDLRQVFIIFWHRGWPFIEKKKDKNGINKKEDE